MIIEFSRFANGFFSYCERNRIVAFRLIGTDSWIFSHIWGISSSSRIPSSSLEIKLIIIVISFCWCNFMFSLLLFLFTCQCYAWYFNFINLKLRKCLLYSLPLYPRAVGISSPIDVSRVKASEAFIHSVNNMFFFSLSG